MKRYKFNDMYLPEYSFDGNEEGDWVKYDDIKKLIDTLKSYLTFNSSDGKIERVELRNKLKQIIQNI